MSYSISTYTLFSLPIDTALEALISKGWKSIEIMGEGTHHGRILLDLDSSELIKIAKLGKDNGVSFAFHLPIEGFNPALADEVTLGIWKKCLSIIEIFEMKYVLFHAGSNPSVQTGVESTAQFAREILKELPVKTKLVIENVPRVENTIGSSMEELISIIKKINDPRVGIMLDTGHCYMNYNEDFLEECQKVFGYLFGLHINDNHGEYDEHLQIGEGTIPFEQLFSNLAGKDLEFVLETNSMVRAENSKNQIIKYLNQKSWRI